MLEVVLIGRQDDIKRRLPRGFMRTFVPIIRSPLLVFYRRPFRLHFALVKLSTASPPRGPRRLCTPDFCAVGFFCSTKEPTNFDQRTLTKSLKRSNDQA